MSIANRLVTVVAGILLVVSIVCAQEQNVTTSRSTTTVTAAGAAGRVRFTAPSTVVQMRLEVYAESGAKLFDSEIRGGNVIDWHLQDGQAERVSDGSYLCVVTTKSLSGRISQKLGKIAIENAGVSVQPTDTTQLTAQQTQAVGPLEENASLVVLKEDQRQTPTVIAHNGEEGQITRGRGALTFRVGDFYSGKDTEQMRLTAEGNLGIGLTNPQGRLDVDGLIRASQGIIFPDGTTQYSAASKTLGAKSTMPDQVSDRILGGKHKFRTESVTQDHIAKFTDGGGTLGDSGITETAGGFLGIGTPSPDSLVNIQGTVPSLLGHMTAIRTTGSNNGFGLLMDASGSGNNNLGLAVGGSPKAAFSWDNSRNFLGFVNFNYSANDFSLRVNGDGSLTYHDGVSSAERFRVTAAGNVGIGTTNPSATLDVAGAVNTSSQYNIGGQRVLSIGGNENTFAGAGAGIHNTTGFFNSFFGFQAGISNTTGTENSFFGTQAGQSNTTGGVNSFFGAFAGSQNTTGGANSFFGMQAGQENTTGLLNSFFGFETGVSNTTGQSNSFFGTQAGFSNTTGGDNSFFGVSAGESNTTAGFNSFFGSQAGQNNETGNANSFFGYQAGQFNTTGPSNSFFGYQAGQSNTTGDDNSFFGNAAGASNTTGNYNSFFGVGAGSPNSTGTGNTVVGRGAGQSNTTENNNTFVGLLSNGAAGITNATAIGANASVTQSDSFVLGSINGINGASTSIRVGIGTTTPKAQLHVQGDNIYVGQAGQGIILKSPDGSLCRLLTIDNSGAIVLTAITCP
jgi:hypothetical protein